MWRPHIWNLIESCFSFISRAWNFKTFKLGNIERKWKQDDPKTEISDTQTHIEKGTLFLLSQPKKLSENARYNIPRGEERHIAISSIESLIKSLSYTKNQIFFCKKHWLNMRNQPTCSLTSCKSPRNILPAWRDNAAKWRYLRHRALNLKIVSFVLAQTFYINDILLRATLLAIYLTIRLRARVFYEQIVNEATIARRKRGRVV